MKRKIAHPHRQMLLTRVLLPPYAILDTSFCEVPGLLEKTMGDKYFMAIGKSEAPVTINFHFDPLCPLAWRTALWVREVRNVRPVHVQWRLFSLEIVNRKEGTEPDYENGYGWAALRTLALAQRKGGNELVEQVYLALGVAQHGHGQSIRGSEGVRAALQEAGLD